ncbi:MAG: alpha-amylase family glycosyl hydrolase [Chloroflexota bacterium]
MDFVFGTYINDRLKLANHRANYTGIQHQSRITPTDPKPGEAVTIDVFTGADTPIEHVAVYYTTNEQIPDGKRGIASVGEVVHCHKVQVNWDSLKWGYITHWQATLPPQADGTLVQYCISAWRDDGEEMYADCPLAEDRVQHEAMLHFGNIPLNTPFIPHKQSATPIFAYTVDTIEPPTWSKNATIYQIIIDRFDPGQGRTWLQTENMDDVFGGTLWGVHERLDYISDLGVDCLWLSPIWVSPTYHGYDIANYRKVEPRLGGEEALHAVIQGAHERGMRVLLDMACNHVSDQHPIFAEAFNNEASPYRSWFTFDAQYEYGYKGFFNVKEMPDIKLSHPPARDWMIDNALYWLKEFDIDGYRLDFAHGPGPVFWTYFRRACKAAKPDCLLFGEIIEPPDVLRRYHGRLDGCLDFPLNDALRQTYGWGTWTNPQFDDFLQSHRLYFPSDFVMPAFLDNHDMDRFTHINNDNFEKLEQAVSVQMKQQQPVVILYGSEIGSHHVESARDHGLSIGRVPMVWSKEQNVERLDLYKRHIHQRQKRSADNDTMV